LGEFNLTGLPPGKYDLQIESPGFQTEEKQVDLKPGEVASLDSTLKVGSVSETVEVAAASDAPLGVVTTIANGAHRISLDGSGRLFYLNGDGKKWKAVKPKWQGKVIQVVLISDPKAPFQLTTETGEIWLSPDGAHWHLESKEKK
jgi:hypothetical protein